MTESDVRNFNSLLRDETAVQNIDTMTVEQLKAFLVRFGPLVLSIERVRSFVNDGAAKWYHGNISREIAEDLLNSFSERRPYCHTCFLIRSTPLQNGTHLRDTTYVFAASYIKKIPGSPPELLHTRLYINKQNQLCVPVTTANSPDMFSPIHVPNFLQFLNSIYLTESELCQPVPSDLFSTLAFLEPPIEQSVKVCPDDEKQTSIGYFNLLVPGGDQ